MILACVSAMPSDAAIKTKNAGRSYAGAYQQINAMRYEQEYANAQLATTASATADLPVAIDDENLVEAIHNNDANAPSMSKLESCSMIYPNGVFKWAVPASGFHQTQQPQCVAVVELRDANTKEILATTTVGAGDSIKCNIDYFPQTGYNMSALSRVILPADKEPTIDDVEAIMNDEQKQNAGLKIAAAALISGVAGNLLAPKEAGAQTGDIPLSTGSSQLKGTAIAAATGASVMAASVYSGKVAGDTIKSTAVNAASGMIVGNMLAGANGGGGVLATTKCAVPDGENSTSTTEHDCIVGNFVERDKSWKSGKSEDPTTPRAVYYIINLNGEIKMCYNDGGTDQDECKTYPHRLTNIVIAHRDGSGKSCGNYKELQIKSGQNKNSDRTFCERYKRDTNEKIKWKAEKYTGIEDSSSEIFYKILSAAKVENSKTAYAVFNSGALNKMTGYTDEDWDELRNNKKPVYYYRNHDGSVSNKINTCVSENNTEKCSDGEFEPSKRNASDGGLVDLSNENRIKGTVAGGAVGGALGGVAGYSGAKDEVKQRYVTAIREYEDSLTNFVCMTGGRYLAPYNSYAEIPQLKESDQ